ncbi:MAG TPA: LCP family protein [Marmoricola sp.]|nr:LCP family protein [Marmoricola sp.]
MADSTATTARPGSPHGATAGGRRRTRRARTLAGALGVTVLGAVLPGAGFLWGRRIVLGLLVLVPALGVVAAVPFQVRDLETALNLAVDPSRLKVVAWVLGGVLLLWAVTVVATYWLVRPRDLSRPAGFLGGALVALLCLAVAAPVTLSAYYARVQADLVTHVFKDNRTATAPLVTMEDPWGGHDRVNVLLLGGDGSVTREGVRTDTVILMSMDTRTGDTVMFSLPRNMMNAQFPVDSPLHDLYPDGFRGDGDPAAWMLNAVYGQVPILHPGILGRSDNEGADAVKQAVAGSLGVKVDYYMLVNLQGFEQIVDAMGGVTVNINEPVAIHGNTDLGIPPVGYLQPGPNQRLNGYEALWFARGRWGSDDYERMLRQRCMVNALVEEAKPLNLLRRYQSLAAAGKEIVRTDIPSKLLPAFVDLSLRIKDASVRSVAFVSSDKFFPGDPDFEWLRDAVDRALAPQRDPARPSSPRPTPTDADEPAPTPTVDPGAATEVADSCAYHPE